MFWIVISAFIALIVIVNIFSSKKKKKQKNSFNMDERLPNAQIFNESIETPVAISENGNIGIMDPKTSSISTIHIKDINGFEIIIDDKKTSNVTAAAMGTLLFGGIGGIIGAGMKKEKITKIDLLLKTNDPNNPIIGIPLSKIEIKKKSFIYTNLDSEIQKLLTALNTIEKKFKEQDNPAN